MIRCYVHGSSHEFSYLQGSFPSPPPPLTSLCCLWSFNIFSIFLKRELGFFSKTQHQKLKNLQKRLHTANSSYGAQVTVAQATRPYITRQGNFIQHFPCLTVKHLLCHKIAKLRACDIFYHSVVLTRAKLWPNIKPRIYSYPHDLASPCLGAFKSDNSKLK